MKTKRKDFDQFLFHEIEDDDDAERFLEDCLPLIGSVTMFFNGLEQSLDQAICKIISDRTDLGGQIIIYQLSYSAKVDLFKRFSDNLHSCFEDKKVIHYEFLIERLAKSGILRNKVVHSDWENINEKGYAFVKMRISKRGVEQEYVQFSKESLSEIIKFIIDTRSLLEDYWEERSEMLNRTYPL